MPYIHRSMLQDSIDYLPVRVVGGHVLEVLEVLEVPGVTLRDLQLQIKSKSI